MNHFEPSVEEFEEVPSPFTKTTTRTRPSASRTNLFARPLGTVPTEAPMVPTPPRKAASLPVDYMDGEEQEEEETEEPEEVQERRPAVVKPRTSAKAKNKAKASLLPKVGWTIVGLLSLRLVFMERGLLQYWQMDGTLEAREQELTQVRGENAVLATEIRRIELDKGYQRTLAKEHLGVIAADEFLILFAGESPEPQNAGGRRL